MGIEFDLTSELIDQIIYCMENQGKSFLFHIPSKCISPAEDVDDTRLEEKPEEWIPLPAWGSSEGFQLMERFVSSLNNPVYREVLRNALSSGKGVFRNFKNALKGKPEVEKLWYGFKEKQMKEQVLDWYNALRESWGLAKLPELPAEETEDLVLSDFTVEPCPEHVRTALEELDRKAFQESLYGESPEIVEFCFINRHRKQLETGTSVIFTALSPASELAGFVWMLEKDMQNGIFIGWLYQLFVEPEFRGLGLAKSLLETYIRGAELRGISRVFADLSGNAMQLNNSLALMGFSQFSGTYSLKL